MAIRFRSIIALILLLAVAPGATAYAQTVRIELEPVVSGLNAPVLLTNAADGTGRRFILEQPGRILVMPADSTARSVFLDITGRVLSGGERGLLGLAFHPQYETNRRFFVNYTRRPDGATVVAEYQASAANPNIAETTERILLTISQPFDNHNGGMIAFGPDGLLYIGMGDGGSGNDPGNRAQNMEELLGKMLRIDVDRSDPGLQYASPPGNPFFGSTAGRDEIFASGFRNPWRFSFDRLTGLLYAGDVGQNAIEEIDIVNLGGNYGWRVFEGTRCTNLGPAPCVSGNYVAPITQYNNLASSGGRCSVTGGYVYRGSRNSLPGGAYVFGDFCTGEILMFRDGAETVLLDTPLNITSFGEDEAGEIYVVGQSGAISRITNPDAAVFTSVGFSTGQGGAYSVTTSGGATSLTEGYARIQADPGTPLPGGVAVFGLRQGGMLVSEASVPVSPLILSGRIFAEVAGPVNTGLAIANPNNQAVRIAFYFTDENGTDFGHNNTTIPANSQLAAFLDQAPFGSTPVRGAFTFEANALVSAISLRGFTNERGDFLLTTLPVADLNPSLGVIATAPHFADGTGWRTQLVLINPTAQLLSGTVQFLNPAGQASGVAVEGQAGSTFPYSIPPNSSVRLRTTGTSGSLQSGSVRVAPAGNTPVPTGVSIFSFRTGGVTVSEAGVPVLRSGTAFRSYVQGAGNFNSAAPGSMQTGFAVANPSATAVTVNLELRRSDGGSPLNAEIVLPPFGQRAMFVSELAAFAGQAGQPGVLRFSASAPISVVSLRSRYNERRDFLITTTTPTDETRPPLSSELLFPHLAEGGGYTMQLILLAPRPDQAAVGTMYFFGTNGQPLPLALQ